MSEALSNAMHIIENHFKYKIKHVAWKDEESKEKVMDIIEEATSIINDYIWEELHTTDFEIERAIKEMDENYMTREQKQELIDKENYLATYHEL